MTNSALTLIAQAEGGLLGSPIIMMVVIFVMFFFLIIRPQQKQKKELQERVSSMAKGDQVVTTGGIHAVVHQKNENTVTLKLSEGVFVKFSKESIQSVAKKVSQTEVKEEEKESK